MLSDNVLRIVNIHAAECGTAPNVTNDGGRSHLGYFENAFGDQWLFVYDRATRTAEVRGGDLDWDTAFPVRDGVVDADLILASEVVSWIRLCWQTATAYP